MGDSVRNRAVGGFMRWILPRLQDILWCGVFFGVLMMGPRLLNMDGDLGRHLIVGETILTSGEVPQVDLFSHTKAGEPFTPHEWLAEVLFALSYRLGGLNGVVVLCAALIATITWLVYRAASRVSKGVVIPLVAAILSAAAGSIHWLARPHLFTMALVIIWWSELDLLRRGESKRWWIFPLLMGAWVNTHGAFIAGVVLWVMAAAGYALDPVWWGKLRWSNITLRNMLFAGVSTVAVTGLNPAGYSIWQTSAGYIGNQYLTGHTQEYLSPDFHQSETWMFLLLIILGLIIFALLRARPEITFILVICGWMAMGLYSARNIPLFAMLAGVIYAELVSDSWKEGILDKLYSLDRRLRRVEESLAGYVIPVLFGIVLALGVIGGGLRLDRGQVGNRFDERVFPVRAVDWMETNGVPEGKMFNYFPWGGYLLYRMFPEQRVFIDGQTDFYGEAFTRVYENILTLQNGWDDVLQQYDVQWIILPVDERLSSTLAELDTWKLIYIDEVTVIYVRQ